MIPHNLLQDDYFPVSISPSSSYLPKIFMCPLELTDQFIGCFWFDTGVIFIKLHSPHNFNLC